MSELKTATAPKIRHIPIPVYASKRAGICAATGLGLLTSIFIDIGARVSIAELILIGYLILQIVSTRKIPLAVGPYICGLTFLMLGFLLANAAHESGTEGIFRGIGGIGIFILSMIALAQFLRVDFQSRLASIIFGSAVGEVIGFYVSPTPEILIDPWKFGIGNAVTIIAILILTRWLGNWSGWGAMPVLLVALAAVHFTMGSRSLAGILMLAVTLVVVNRGKVKYTKANSAGYFAVIGLVVVGVLNLYSRAAESGFLGEDSEIKYNEQNGAFGVLPGARKELLLLVVAWIKSPIFGWGPKAVIDNGHLGDVYNWYISNGYIINASDFNRLFNVDALPLHSIVLGFLVQAGLFALPLIILLLRPWVRALSFGISSKNLLITFVALSGGVHLLTSPLGDTTRFPVAISLAIGLIILSNAKQSKIHKIWRPAPGQFVNRVV